MSAALRTAWGLARSLAIYRARPWRQAGLVRLYSGLLEPGALAFDIGAHAGNRTLALRRAGARVVALEPQRAFHGFLRRTLPSDVTLLRLAAGPCEGAARLAVSRLHPTVSSLRRDVRDSVGAGAGFEHVVWDGEEAVETTTLDALIARFGAPRFVKIDVEGYEDAVLAGLSRPVPVIAFEYLPAALGVARASVARLAALGGYRFNLVRGESAGFALDRWRPAGEIVAEVERCAADGSSGDIYARLDDHAPPGEGAGAGARRRSGEATG